MEASDLMHEVSEAAERRSDADADEAPDRVSGSIEEVEEDDEADAVETVGQRVVATESNGEAAAESVESVGSEDALEEVRRARRRRRRAATRSKKSSAAARSC